MIKKEALTIKELEHVPKKARNFFGTYSPPPSARADALLDPDNVLVWLKTGSDATGSDPRGV